MEENKEKRLDVDKGTIDAYKKRIGSLKSKVEELEKKQENMVEMVLQYQGYIDAPPKPKQELYAQACSNDGATITSWQKIWLDHVAENVKHLNDDTSVIKLHKSCAGRPGLIAGSGPSLKKNYKHLLNKPDYMSLTSALHNYAWFEDEGIQADYFVNLDAGDVTISEMSSAGKESADYYWESTKDKVLIAALVSHPDLIRRWKGKIYWYNTLGPTKEYIDALRKITKYNVVYNVGGNTLGASLYHSRAVLGCNPIAFVGADFCFGYNRKFHPFDSDYDNMYAGLMPATDVYGNRVYTWQSYYNFKSWFDYQACGGAGNNPTQYINCTEGGLFGSYPEGNIRQVNQMKLEDFIQLYRQHEVLPDLLSSDEHPYAFVF